MPHTRAQCGPTHPTHAGEAHARARTGDARPRVPLCSPEHANESAHEGQIQSERVEMALDSRARGGGTPPEPPLGCPGGTPSGADTTRPPPIDRSVDGSLSAVRSRAASEQHQRYRGVTLYPTYTGSPELLLRWRSVGLGEGMG